jgi:hypothetical protein
LLEEIVEIGKIVIVKESLVTRPVWIPVTLGLIRCGLILCSKGRLKGRLGWWRKCGYYFGEGGCLGKVWLLGESLRRSKSWRVKACNMWRRERGFCMNRDIIALRRVGLCFSVARRRMWRFGWEIIGRLVSWWVVGLAVICRWSLVVGTLREQIW